MPNLMRDLTTVSIRVCVESFMLRCMAREAAKSHGAARNNLQDCFLYIMCNFRAGKYVGTTP